MRNSFSVTAWIAYYQDTIVHCINGILHKRCNIKQWTFTGQRKERNEQASLRSVSSQLFEIFPDLKLLRFSSDSNGASINVKNTLVIPQTIPKNMNLSFIQTP